MTNEFERSASRARYGLLVTALGPVVPQILGSAFNIWYNATVIEPMLTPALRQRFFATVVVYNAIVYPLGVYLWLKRIFSFRELFYHTLIPGLIREGKTVIAITHDDRYFHLADRVIKIECGKLVTKEQNANFLLG